MSDCFQTVALPLFVRRSSVVLRRRPSSFLVIRPSSSNVFLVLLRPSSFVLCPSSFVLPRLPRPPSSFVFPRPSSFLVQCLPRPSSSFLVLPCPSSLSSFVLVIVLWFVVVPVLCSKPSSPRSLRRYNALFVASLMCLWLPVLVVCCQRFALVVVLLMCRLFVLRAARLRTEITSAYEAVFVRKNIFKQSLHQDPDVGK